MRKTNLPKSRSVYLIFAALWIVLMAIMPRTGKLNYDYRKGSPWSYETLVAQFDFPILKTQEQLQAEREEAGSSVIPYYKYSEEIAQTSIASAASLSLGNAGIRQQIVTSLRNIYSKGILSEGSGKERQSDIILLQRDKRTSKSLYSDTYSVASARTKLLSDVVKAYPGTNADSLLTANSVYDLLVPNLIYDNETTELVHAENADYISPTMGFVSAGQLIVSKGELVTAEIYQLLDSYKAEYENSLGYSGPIAGLLAGNAIIALVILLILFLSILYTNPLLFEDMNRFLYLIFVFTLATAAAIFVERTNPDWLYMTPFTLTALYLRTFFRKRVVLPVYVCSLIPLLIFSHSGSSLFTMFFAAGVVTIYAYEYLSKGWRQFMMALTAFLTLFFAYAGFCLINDENIWVNFNHVISLAFGSFLSVAGFPLVFLFEKVFSLVSINKLLELCDTGNNKLITELSQKAPGTFQHSLQVMNMSDAVASEIGADSLLARTGALYHDIGKIANPQCFIENEAPGTNYHKNLTPKESAREITKHVTAGVEIAAKHSLPQVIVDFILSHHGTSSTGYFYNKYLNDGGNPDDTADFFYQGKKPQTKEQAIVMLCDTIEAASRTLKDNTPETFNTFVDNIVASKMSSGQLSECDLTLKELEQVKAKLKSYLAQLYHDRISYPKRNSEAKS